MFTRQQAIDAHCKDCNFDDQDIGTWRSQIESCTSPDCPLYEYRPLTNTTLKLRQEAKIKAMTPDELAKYRLKQDSARIRLSTGKKQQELHSEDAV